MTSYSPGAPTEHTVAANRPVLTDLPFDDTADLENARRGFLGSADVSHLRNAAGLPVWDVAQFDFLDGTGLEESINPSLLRMARLNSIHGLFEVVEGVYQVRGFDLSNVTFVEGDTGVIVIDPLTTVEVADAALALYREHRGPRPITAMIYTHSHVDHYGGGPGVVDREDVAAGRVRVIAPEGFLEEAIAENVYAGNAMQRRSMFQYGWLLATGPRGAVDAGLGKRTSNGTPGLIAPTEYVSTTRGAPHRRRGGHRVLHGSQHRGPCRVPAVAAQVADAERG